MNGDDERPVKVLKAHLEAVTSIAGALTEQIDARARRDSDALEQIRGWNWEQWDYDDCKSVPMVRSIKESVNDLAMCGGESPADTIISLLAAGKLTAEGNWRWRSYKNFQQYENEGLGAIPAHRWETFLAIESDVTAEMDRSTIGCKPTVQLTELGLGETERYEMVWQDNWFSYAIEVAGDGRCEKTEEWFSANDIYLIPPQATTDSAPAEPIAASTAASNNGGRPHVLNWEAAALEMAGRYYRGDFKPQSISDVVGEIQKWANQADGGPNDNTARPHAKRIFEAFKTWEADF